MSNRVAPYNDEAFMAKVNTWWRHSFPDNKTDVMHVMELYKSFMEYAKIEPYSPEWIDANQFAKCLVAARIADVAGWWSKLPTWEPKEYEIKRARAY